MKRLSLKATSLILALVLALSLSVTAFADDNAASMTRAEVTQEVIKGFGNGNEPVNSNFQLLLIACPFPLRVPFSVLLAALRAGRNNGQPIFSAQPVADMADLRIAFAVGNVLLVFRKIHSTENDMVMAMLLVDVGSNDILILAAEDFIGKLPPDLVGLRIADLARLTGLSSQTQGLRFPRRSRTRTPAAYRRSLPDQRYSQ